LNRRPTLLDKSDYTIDKGIQLTSVGKMVTLPVTVSPMMLDQRTSEPTLLSDATVSKSR
jgi:hypothetical protein